MWKTVDLATQKTIPHLQGEHCVYARDYISNGGFAAGPTNNLVTNFKKNPGANGQGYRNQAVKQFASEASLLIDCDKPFPAIITAIPSSKILSDPQYNRRFEDLFIELQKLSPCIKIDWPIVARSTVASSRHGGSRDPAIIASNYLWQGFSLPEEPNLCVFDDVLISGCHFRAFFDFARASGYTGNIVGVFWAKG